MLNNSAGGGSPTDWVVAEKRISKQGAHDVGLEDDEGGADDDNDTALCKQNRRDMEYSGDRVVAKLKAQLRCDFGKNQQL